jgi:hypothetical protein
MWYQLCAGQYPTKAYLHRIGHAPDDNCPFGCTERETTGHFLCRCPAFADARTKAHDTAWEETLPLLTAGLPKTTQVFTTTPIRSLPISTRPTPATGPVANLTPDATLIDEESRCICILEYTRPSDTVIGALGEGAHRKEVKYRRVVDALTEYSEAGWEVAHFPLPVGVRGTLSPDHWTPALEMLGIPTAKHRGLLNRVAAISIRASHLLHVCRHQRLRAPQTTTLRHRRREFAETRWGTYPSEVAVAEGEPRPQAPPPAQESRGPLIAREARTHHQINTQGPVQDTCSPH